MIKLKTLELTDFGRHEKISAKFDGHVIGLTGPNGLGKSTVLQALQFALTGDIATETVEPLNAFIRRSSGEKPPKAMQVEVDFEVDGRPGKIVRRVTRTGGTRKLWWDGAEKPIISAAGVDSVMFEVLGSNKAAINSTVFIRQGEMDSMFGKDAERREFYTRLMMLAYLEKIAGIVESHRKHQADSVQDLGAVRDAAAATYEEAREYFEACDRELGLKPDRSAHLKALRGLLGRYESLAAAEERTRKVAASCADLRARHGEDQPGWLSRARQDLDKHRKALEALARRKSLHIEKANEASNAQKRFQQVTDDAEEFLEFDRIREQLDALEPTESATDPYEDARRHKDTIDKFNQMSELEKLLPGYKKDWEEATEKRDRTLEAAATAEEVYNQLREDWVRENGMLKMQKVIKENLGAADVDCCPTCGAEKPDLAYLDMAISKGEASVADLEESGSAAGEFLAELKDAKDKAADEKSRAEKVFEVTDQKLKRLKVELSLKDLEKARAGLRAAEEAKAVINKREGERDRLNELGRVLHAKLQTRVRPSASLLNGVQAALEKARQEAEEWPWGDAEEEAESAERDAAEALRSEIEAVHGAISDFESATEAEKDAGAKLQSAIEGLSEDLVSSLNLEGALTTEEVGAAVAQVEHAQGEHDEARGRKEAAEESLRAASRKVDELDLRTAEQKHRLKLVADLELVRDTFKPNGASLDFLNYKFGQIARLAADYLAESGADFMVAPSETLSLSYEFLRTDRADEVWLPQSRMSGGQKVRLAVATLRAIHAMIMPDMGLLVLDEPTTHLDDEAKRSMADMLRRIGDEGTLQMVVCDHSPILVDAFSDMIDIEG